MTALGPISGLSSAWLAAGAAASAIPIVIHLVRRRRRTVLFPPAALLKDSVQASRRAARPREWMILALRMLIVALLALAFDQPALRVNEGVAHAAGVQTRQLVIVLDQSASMQRIHNGQSLFEHARDQAINILDELRPGADFAGVVFLRRNSAAALPELTVNHAALRARMDEAACTFERGDIASAASAVRMLLAGREDARTDVMVITDGQLAQWGKAPELSFSNMESINVDFQIVGQPDGNVRLGHLSIESTPGGVQIGAPITNFDSEPRTTPVTLRAGVWIGAQKVSVAPGETAMARFDLRWPETEMDPVALHATIPTDAALYDNNAFGWLAPHSSRRVALIDSNSMNTFGAQALYGALSAIDATPTLLSAWDAPTSDAPFDFIVTLMDGSFNENVQFVTDPGMLAPDGVVLMIPAHDENSAHEVAGRRLNILDAERLFQIQDAAALGELARLIQATPVASLSSPSVPDDATVFARFDDDVPLLTRWDAKGVQAAHLNIVLGSRGEGMVRSPLFPMVMQAVVDRLAPPFVLQESHEIGSALEDAGASVAHTPDFITTDSRLHQITMPGAAMLRTDAGRDVSVQAVVDATESDVSERIEWDSVTLKGNSLRSGGRDIELWPWLLFLAAACFIAESRATQIRRLAVDGGAP